MFALSDSGYRCTKYIEGYIYIMEVCLYQAFVFYECVSCAVPPAAVVNTAGPEIMLACKRVAAAMSCDCSSVFLARWTRNYVSYINVLPRRCRDCSSIFLAPHAIQHLCDAPRRSPSAVRPCRCARHAPSACRRRRVAAPATLATGPCGGILRRDGRRPPARSLGRVLVR